MRNIIRAASKPFQFSPKWWKGSDFRCGSVTIVRRLSTMRGEWNIKLPWNRRLEISARTMRRRQERSVSCWKLILQFLSTPADRGWVEDSQKPQCIKIGKKWLYTNLYEPLIKDNGDCTSNEFQDAINDFLYFLIFFFRDYRNLNELARFFIFQMAGLL